MCIVRIDADAPLLRAHPYIAMPTRGAEGDPNISPQDWGSCPSPLAGRRWHSVYGDAEEVLAKVPRRGILMILHETTRPAKTDQALFGERHGQIVRRLRYEAGLPSTFTLA
jgi:hypothetical protein